MAKKIDTEKYVYNVRDVATTRELVETSCELYGNQVAFLYKNGANVTEITYERAGNEIRAFSTYLNSLGLENEKIAVTGKNSYHWLLTYFAVCCGTGVIVPIDKDLRGDEVAYLLEHSETKAIICSPEVLDKVKNSGYKGIIISMEDIPECINRGEIMLREGDTSYRDHYIDPMKLGILLYTSGTTGVSKGVMLSQRNICSNVVQIRKRVNVTPEDRALSILPLHHTFECTVDQALFYSGASIAFNSSVTKLKAELKTFAPTLMACVPLVLETLHRSIMANYSKMKGGKALLSAQKAMAKGLSVSARRKLFSSIHEALGGRIERLVVGAAAMIPNIHEDYELFGCKVYIGYGLTETAPVCIMQNDNYRAVGDTGFPVIGVQCRICDANDEGIGELQVKGSNVMLGYYKNPEETAKVLQDGWFSTGDLVKKNPNGSFSITGRIKSMIVLPNGKKVFPEEQEMFINRSPFVKDSMVFLTEKDGKPVLAVSVYPDMELLNAEAAKRNATAKAIITDLVTEVNKLFPSYKYIGKIIIRENEFVKTTTSKIKRNEPENRNEK
ncbi:MAG: AMP-binding protein [Clostridia bacterium]|nr:AMP-binding protein [Clostridia bacterium]